MSKYTKEAFDEMFEKRERVLIKERQNRERKEREALNLKEHQIVKRIMEDYDF
jgi:hypothetical protein